MEAVQIARTVRTRRSVLSRRAPWLRTAAFCLLGGGVTSGVQAQAQTVADQPATAAAAPVNPAPAGNSSIGDIIVTARRQSESLQTTPVSITALSADVLADRNIRQIRDIQQLVPGVILAGVGSDDNSAFSIRGQGRDIVGPGLPSVIVYVNEVPLPSWGSNPPTYDVSNVQVLKGPQGTLFGRNTTGGAILLYTTPPTFDFGGYGQATVGAYNWHSFEGAVNVPLIDDKLAIRVAGDVERRDGYTKNYGIGGDEDNLHSESFRISVLAQPTSWLKNVTIFDYFHKHENGLGVVPFGITSAQPWASSPFLDAYFGCGTSPTCDVRLAAEQVMSRGPHTVDSDVAQTDQARNWLFSNTTTIDLGGDTAFKNIFGYRDVHVYVIANTDSIPLALLNTVFDDNERQITEEVQFSGKAFDKKLNWLIGGFYLDDKPTGVNDLLEDTLRPSILTQAQWAADGGPEISSQNLYTDNSKAVFGNVIYDLSGLTSALDGVRFNGGVRYTWDRRGACSENLVITQPSFQSLAACQADPAAFSAQVKSSAVSYTIGLDYQVSRELFLYATTRRGYRAGGLNTPVLTGVLAPYQSFSPQFVTDVEIGAHTRYSFGDLKTRFDVAGYRGVYNGLQRQINGIYPQTFNTPNANTPSNNSLTLNSGKSTIEGVEFDGTLAYGPLTVTFNGSYLHSKYDSLTVPALFAPLQIGGATFNNSPAWSYGVNGRFDFGLPKEDGRLSVSANFYHLDHFINSDYTVPGYNLTDLTLDWDNFLSKNVTLSVFVNNVFDKVYYRNGNLVSSSLGVFDGGWGPPRMVGGRIRFNFGK